VLIYTGRTTHVVPGEQGAWNVVDLQRRGWSFPTRAAALDWAKHIAAANQPSQVVLIDAFGRVEPIAHYQLPTYQLPQVQNQSGASLFEATVKALLIGGFADAGSRGQTFAERFLKRILTAFISIAPGTSHSNYILR